jgi:hypothetical protein
MLFQPFRAGVASISANHSHGDFDEGTDRASAAWQFRQDFQQCLPLVWTAAPFTESEPSNLDTGSRPCFSGGCYPPGRESVPVVAAGKEREKSGGK